MFDFLELILISTSSITLFTTVVLLVFYKYGKEQVNVKILPSVSVFVPYYNEDSDVLLKTLSYLDNQEYPLLLEVLIIDDGSTNDSKKAVEQWLNVPRRQKYLLINKHKNNGRKGFALDYALSLEIATGDAYVIVDSDTFIQSDGIKELVSKLWSDDRYAAVCGYITPNNYKDSFIGLLQHYEHISFYGAIRSAQDKLGCVPVLAGAFVAHRASIIKDLGGWSEWLVEDIAWCWKAISNGYKTGYAPKAKASTQCPIDSKGLFNQRRRWARGRVEAFVVAWKTHWFAGICSTPWFFITASQYIFPSSLILLGLMLVFHIWIPLILGGINMIVYLILLHLYIKENDLQRELTTSQILKAPLFSLVLESITWLPNLLGYIDEILRKKKIWLTR
ncbi:glycosyltransferase family 2 protein [Photobacterium kishitanii]|uniref:glycosyltransferase family 2 protein n=1 Tax=Photobacterium kishitanii TaxID=318456 RepID=UPI0005D32BF9|nr:glycosyltransferase family 2 protein [Photobacterium kishitanii]KJG10605.1 chitin synthase [Photobacterium kishitanii]OBU30120.1 chitin synthase [Photobacterium kishitanii]PSU17240.1 chitin synthase [Photobacterium kishitanii]PSV07928.1 chitin synthase [Photobacterium kishitanii]PSV72906.1 chitin synthase [Photobacterium kishitanii]